MKRCLLTVCFFIAALAVYAGAIQEELELAGEQARISYAFGMVVGGDLQQTGVKIDYPAFLEGLKAAMEQGYTRLGSDEAYDLVQDAFEIAMIRQSMELREKEATFLAENAARTDVTVTRSGLQYTVLEEGNGPKPGATDTVLVHYEGALTDGKVFDSSYNQGQPEEIPLDRVIPGWTEGIQLMNVGSKYLIYIPSNLAYGERGAGQVIPPYSTLIFTIELLGIVDNDNSEE